MVIFIYILLAGTLAVSWVHYYQDRAWARPMVITTSIAILIFSICISLRENSWNKEALENRQKLQNIQGEIVGKRLAEAFPQAHVVVVRSMQMDATTNTPPLNEPLARSLISELQAGGITVEERILPTPGTVLDILNQAETNENEEKLNTPLSMAKEGALMNQPQNFIQMAKEMKGDADIVVSLIEIPKMSDLQFPSPSESPKLVLFNCWLDNPEDVLQHTAVISIVRTNNSVDIDHNMKGGPNEIFNRYFEYVSIQ